MFAEVCFSDDSGHKVSRVFLIYWKNWAALFKYFLGRRYDETCDARGKPEAWKSLVCRDIRLTIENPIKDFPEKL